MCGHACSMTLTCRSENDLCELVLFLSHVGLKHGTQGLGLGSKHPNLLSCVTYAYFKKIYVLIFCTKQKPKAFLLSLLTFC